MFINPKYIYPGVPQSEVETMSGMRCAPLAVDICRLTAAGGLLRMISTTPSEGITLGLESGLPVLRVVGPDHNGEYSVRSFFSEVKRRGDKRLLTSKKIGYLVKQLTPVIQNTVRTAESVLQQQLSNGFQFYRERIRRATGYQSANEWTSVSTAAFHEMMLAMLEGRHFDSLSAISQSQLKEVAEKSAEAVAEGKDYVDKLQEFCASEKFLAGWTARGIYFGMARLQLGAEYNPEIREFTLPLRFHRSWAEMELVHPELHRECLTAFAFLSAHRATVPDAATSRDPEKLFPSNDVVFPALNALSYFSINQIDRGHPQWVVLDRLF